MFLYFIFLFAHQKSAEVKTNQFKIKLINLRDLFLNRFKIKFINLLEFLRIKFVSLLLFVKLHVKEFYFCLQILVVSALIYFFCNKIYDVFDWFNKKTQDGLIILNEKINEKMEYIKDTINKERSSIETNINQKIESIEKKFTSLEQVLKDAPSQINHELKDGLKHGLQDGFEEVIGVVTKLLDIPNETQDKTEDKVLDVKGKTEVVSNGEQTKVVSNLNVLQLFIKNTLKQGSMSEQDLKSLGWKEKIMFFIRARFSYIPQINFLFIISDGISFIHNKCCNFPSNVINFCKTLYENTNLILTNISSTLLNLINIFNIVFLASILSPAIYIIQNLYYVLVVTSVFLTNNNPYILPYNYKYNNNSIDNLYYY